MSHLDVKCRYKKERGKNNDRNNYFKWWQSYSSSWVWYFQIPADGSTYTAVKEALEVGYRHIDTAQAYFNEKEVGQAIKNSGIPREEIFVTSKLWIQDYAYETAKAIIDATLEKMGLDYLDLYLLHQPYGKVEEAWKTLEEAKEAGKIKSIGV